MRVPAMQGFPNRTPASTEIPGKTSIVHLLGALFSGESYALGAGRGNALPHGGGRLWRSLTARAHYSLTQLLAQAPHRLGLAAHAQERALGIGALLQHRAGGEDLPAQFLRRPGKEELGLDQAPLEERDYRLAQPGDVALPLRAHHDTSGVLCAQRRLVPTAVDLVEDDKARH